MQEERPQIIAKCNANTVMTAYHQLDYHSNQNLAWSCLKTCSGTHKKASAWTHTVNCSCRETVGFWKTRAVEAASRSERGKSELDGEEAEKLKRGFNVVSCLGVPCTVRIVFASCSHRTGSLWVTFKRNSPVTTFSPLITCYTFTQGPTLPLNLEPILHASLRQYPALLRETNITLWRRRHASINFPF